VDIWESQRIPLEQSTLLKQINEIPGLKIQLRAFKDDNSSKQNVIESKQDTIEILARRLAELGERNFMATTGIGARMDNLKLPQAVDVADEVAKHLPASASPASLGNLAERAITLSEGLLRFIKFREEVQKSSFQHPQPPLTREESMKKTNDISASSFHRQYEPQVIALRDEAAELHFVEPELDRELNNLKQMRQYDPSYFSLVDVLAIKLSLERLAESLKRAAPSH